MDLKCCHPSDIVGTSAALRKALMDAQVFAESDRVHTILVTGETGTGKELVAEYLHRVRSKSRGSTSARTRPIALNCAGLSDSLLESQLFGHERGAFTDARASSLGLVRTAAEEGGTLFLDEVGETSPAIQTRLLRLLDRHPLEILPVGARTPVFVDNVMIVMATNRDLVAEASNGKFRNDLMYRLMAFTVHMPSLRERREDVPSLVEHFIEVESRGRISGISPTALNELCDYHWPGNVRELRTTIACSVVHAGLDCRRLERIHWPLRSRSNADCPCVTATDSCVPARLPVRLPLPETLADLNRAKALLELQTFERTLSISRWNIGEASARLGCESRQHLPRRIQKLFASHNELLDDERLAALAEWFKNRIRVGSNRRSAETLGHGFR